MVHRRHAATLYVKLLYFITYPRIMTEGNVFATVGMSATVGGNVCNSGGNVCSSGGTVCSSGGTVCNSGEIEYGLGNLRVEIVIHNSA